MIQVTMTYKCRACGNENIVKNGRNKAGNAQYHCKDCGAYRVLVPKSAEQPERRRQVLQAYLERASLRGLGRIVSVSLVLFVKRYRSPSRIAIMSLLPVGLSFNTISVLHRFGLKASA